MAIVLCPHCQTRVALDADNECPSCRRTVVEEQRSRSASPVNRFADVANEARSQSAAPPVDENPYAAPREFNRASDAAPMHAPRGGLLRQLFSFQGRIPRRVYWGTYLLTMLTFYLALFFLAALFGEESSAAGVGFVVLYAAMLWIVLALTVKRWHDRDKSGFWVFISLIPILGPLWQFIEVGCMRGTVGPNQYGEDPTGDELSSEFERLRNDAESVWGDGEPARAYAAGRMAERLDECPWCEAVVLRAGDSRCSACNRPV